MSDLEFKEDTVKKEYPKGTLFMHKAHFSVCGPSEELEGFGNHIIISHKQAKELATNPKVIGPKIILFEMKASGSGISDKVKDEAFMEVVRGWQAEADKEKAPKAKAPAKTVEPPAPANAPTGLPAIDDIIKMLELMDGVGDVKKYAKETLSMPSFAGNPGKDNVIAKVREFLLTPETVAPSGE